LPIPPDHVLLFDAKSPKDKTVSQRALIYGDKSDQVVFLDLADVEAKKGRNVETLTLDSTIASIIPLLDLDKPKSERKPRVVILQATGGVSLLDLAQRTVAPIDSSAQLQNALFDP